MAMMNPSIPGLRTPIDYGNPGVVDTKKTIKDMFDERWRNTGDTGSSGSTASTGNGYDAYSALMSYWDSLRAEANAVWNKWLKQRQSENADYRRKVVDQANISKLQTARGLRQTPNSGPKLSRFVQSNLGHLNTVAEAKREENKANQNDSITAQQGKLGVQTQVANLQSQWLPYLIQNGYTGSLNL